MTIELTAFRWVPPFAQGYVRDLRVRWALEEAGLPYRVRLIDAEIQKSARYRQWQPFGQVPAYKDDSVEMFESGAIVLHIAFKSKALAPLDDAGRARVMTTVFAAMNSIEPHVQNFLHLNASHAGSEGAMERSKQAKAMLERRLAALSGWLGDNQYFDRRFTAGDLMMTTVLRELGDSGILAAHPALDAYRRRCEARPAFTKALAAQLQTFRENTPA